MTENRIGIIYKSVHHKNTEKLLLGIKDKVSIDLVEEVHNNISIGE